MLLTQAVTTSANLGVHWFYADLQAADLHVWVRTGYCWVRYQRQRLNMVKH